MTGSNYIGSIFIADVNSPILATCNNDATVQWLKDSLNAKHFKKKPVGWMSVFEAKVKVKVYPKDNIPGSDISHLAIALRKEFKMEDADIALQQQGFTIESNGQFDEAGYGWRIYRAAESLGSFHIHVAKRQSDDFELA